MDFVIQLDEMYNPAEKFKNVHSTISLDSIYSSFQDKYKFLNANAFYSVKFIISIPFQSISVW